MIPYDETNNNSRHGWFHDSSKNNQPLWPPATTTKKPWNVYTQLDWLSGE